MTTDMLAPTRPMPSGTVLLKPMYRMPTAFGPAPGPRNLPADQEHRRYDKDTTTLTVSAATDGERLARLLPPGFALREARIEISLMVLTNVGWLAGRGYNILIVRIPARFEGRETIEGHFVPVVWESMADPILTGRDELGWSKINAQIPDPVVTDGRWQAGAAWEGFRFCEIEADGFAPATAAAGPPQPMLFRKYVPRTGAWGQADVDQVTATAPDGPPPTIHSAEQGAGRFAFRAARWEDMPTQYPIVNAFADLPLGPFGPATLVRSSGGGDAGKQRIVA